MHTERLSEMYWKRKVKFGGYYVEKRAFQVGYVIIKFTGNDYYSGGNDQQEFLIVVWGMVVTFLSWMVYLLMMQFCALAYFNTCHFSVKVCFHYPKFTIIIIITQHTYFGCWSVYLCNSDLLICSEFTCDFQNWYRLCKKIKKIRVLF